MFRVSTSVKKILYNISILLLLITLFQLYSIITDSIGYKNRIAREVIELRSSFDWTKMTDKDTPYNQMMLGFFTVFSHKYDVKYKKALSPDERVRYIRENKFFADTLGFNRFEGVTIDIMETSLNPYLDHEFGEAGISGFKYATALFAEKVIDNHMPDNYKKILKVNLKSKEDLKNPFISMRLKYALLWYERKQFNGRQDWYVSIFHWGGFLAKHWDYKEGVGEVPISFTLNGKKYNVMKYYVAFRSTLAAFNKGDLSAGKEIVEKYQAYYARLCKEEIDFRNTRRIIRNLRKKISCFEDAGKKKDEKLEEMKKALLSANKQLYIISGEAKRGGGKKALRKVKDVAKGLVKILGGD